MAHEYPPLECVEWDDTTNAAPWKPLEDLIEWATTADFTVRSVGYVLHEDDHCILLSAQYAPDPVEGDQAGVYSRIPKGMITRRWALAEVDD